MSEVLEFVCVFLFNERMRLTYMVKKSKGPTPDNPNGQKGKLNGWGGKQEINDWNIWSTAVREIKEESDLEIDFQRFIYFHGEKYTNGAHVHYFYVILSNDECNQLVSKKKSNDGDRIITRRVIMHGLYSSSAKEFVWNVPYLILMARAINSFPIHLRPRAIMQMQMPRVSMPDG